MIETSFVSEHDIRAAFSEAMSKMYRREVPLYGELMQIVEASNARALRDSPSLALALRRAGAVDRLGQERHGAIRLGSAEELSMMRRALAVLGMHPVGYYDLSVAGVPVHSTAFRPTDLASLNRNPFRLFTSLLRLDLIEDGALRKQASDLLRQRRIFNATAVELIEQYELAGGLNRADADAFVGAILETFRWQSDAQVDSRTYADLLEVHRLVADVVSFRGPHINHLTPGALDIDAAQAEMQARGIDAKAVIEGPPRRSTPILLRQTSFKALEEPVAFLDDRAGASGTHTARFGEIEQRGLALTPKGRALYDALLEEARGETGSQGGDYAARLAAAFERFPDDLETLRREGLGYFQYAAAETLEAPAPGADLDALIAAGAVTVSPVIYEDFLPVSAAGIFQSNLGGGEQKAYDASEAQAAFEISLGAPVADPFALYAAVERQTLTDLSRRFQTPLVPAQSDR